LVREFRASGQTQKAFARRHNIKWTTFRNWLYGRSGRRATQRPVKFQEIRVTPVAGWTSPWAAEISLESGAVVRLQAGADPQWVGSIIQPLRQSC
jgi:hypothetical protein